MDQSLKTQPLSMSAPFSYWERVWAFVYSLLPPAADVDTFNKWHWMDAAEVVVQAFAVILIWRAVVAANKANAEANEANKTSREILIGQMREQHADMLEDRYNHLDRFYYDLIRERISYPLFGSPDKMKITSDMSPEEKRLLGEQFARYQAYALTMFNFLEAIADKISQETTEIDFQIKEAKANRTKVAVTHNPFLLDTWGPILDLEAKVHGDWLTAKDASGRLLNEKYFKPEFFKFATELIATTKKQNSTELKAIIAKYA